MARPLTTQLPGSACSQAISVVICQWMPLILSSIRKSSRIENNSLGLSSRIRFDIGRQNLDGPF